MDGQGQLIRQDNEYLKLKDASDWASEYLQRPVTSANISYLIQYGKINRYGPKGSIVLSIKELKAYYSQLKQSEQKLNKQGVDWHLSFSNYKEAETTKHVHRIHPYKGKFIPQLVEYFLCLEEGGKRFFHPGDIILDPFCGSGTTLVQANESKMHAIGIDVSAFNVMISNSKIDKYQLNQILEEGRKLSAELINFQIKQGNLDFESELRELLSSYNFKYFNGQEYRSKIKNNEIDEKAYAADKESRLAKDYTKLVAKYKLELAQSDQDSFLGKWFLPPVRAEIDFLLRHLKKIKDPQTRKILGIVLSRTVRSCRATTHSDLGTLKQPVTSPYYCAKHFKLCRPIFSTRAWWDRYLQDTVSRLARFDELRTDTHQICLTGDSRTLDIPANLKQHPLKDLLAKQKIKGVFSSPPYVGLIDYHEQHAYSYELLGFSRQDEDEIGPMFRGQGQKAKDSYKEGIAAVLGNCKRFLREDYDIFLVANDKHNLYPTIAEAAGMNIVKRFKRPVLNRVEKDRNNTYCEEIFHLKQKQ